MIQSTGSFSLFLYQSIEFVKSNKKFSYTTSLIAIGVVAVAVGIAIKLSTKRVPESMDLKSQVTNQLPVAGSLEEKTVAKTSSMSTLSIGSPRVHLHGVPQDNGSLDGANDVTDSISRDYEIQEAGQKQKQTVFKENAAGNSAKCATSSLSVDCENTSVAPENTSVAPVDKPLDSDDNKNVLSACKSRKYDDYVPCEQLPPRKQESQQLRESNFLKVVEELSACISSEEISAVVNRQELIRNDPFVEFLLSCKGEALWLKNFQEHFGVEAPLPISFSLPETPNGIHNLGNSCYAASIFQILLMQSTFLNRTIEILSDLSADEIAKQATIFIILKKICNNEANSLKEIFSPLSELVKKIFPHDSTGPKQPDEFFQALPTEKIKLRECQSNGDVFEQEVSVIRTVYFEETNALSDAVNNSLSFYDQTLVELPEHLPIYIERLDSNGSGKVLSTPYSIPEELTLKSEKQGVEERVLYGGVVVFQKDNTNHYVALRRKSVAGSDEWFVCNDDKINSLNTKAAKQMLATRAVLLFYGPKN